jgi:hypothetical protein
MLKADTDTYVDVPRFIDWVIKKSKNETVYMGVFGLAVFLYTFLLSLLFLFLLLLSCIFALLMIAFFLSFCSIILYIGLMAGQ